MLEGMQMVKHKASWEIGFRIVILVAELPDEVITVYLMNQHKQFCATVYLKDECVLADVVKNTAMFNHLYMILLQDFSGS